jgi:predicted RNA-binding Zn ribbon-like protein
MQKDLGGGTFFELEAAGGRLWIDFANTLALASAGHVDALATPEAFIEWAARRGLPRPMALASLVPAAQELRGGLVESLASGPSVVISAVNKILENSRSWPRIEQEVSAWKVVVIRRHETVEDVLAPIAESFAETLARVEWARIRKCGRPDCHMHFLDETKNGRRRWCSMALCGNRMKAARHYHRARGPVVGDHSAPNKAGSDSDA